MSVGYPVTKADVDNRAGTLVVGLWTALRDAAAFCDWLQDSTHDDTFLQGLGFTGSSSTGDIKTLRDSFTDLKSLYNVAHAAGTVPSNNNFFFSAKKLSGVTLAN